MAYLTGGMECCALDELTDLTDYSQDPPTPEYSMFTLCRARSNVYKKGKLYPFPGTIIFTGVIAYKGTGVKPTYGQRFARFITRNKLGTVVGGKPAYNRINHPSHLVRTWVWNPDQRALEEWFKEALKRRNGEMFGDDEDRHE
jgi:hypothetical protein